LRPRFPDPTARSEQAEKAVAALKVLNHRPDMVSYIIVKEVDAWFTK